MSAAVIWVTKRPREAVRLPAVATLVLAGPRVSELCKLDEPGVDLAARRIRMPRVKTDASERTVPMVPALHEILLAASAERETRGGPAFPTRNGTRSLPTTFGRGSSRPCENARTNCSQNVNSS